MEWKIYHYLVWTFSNCLTRTWRTQIQTICSWKQTQLSGCWWTDCIHWSLMVHLNQSRSNQAGMREDRPARRATGQLAVTAAFGKTTATDLLAGNERIGWNKRSSVRLLPGGGDWECDCRGGTRSSRRSGIKSGGAKTMGGWEGFSIFSDGWWVLKRKRKNRTRPHGHISTIYLQFFVPLSRTHSSNTRSMAL